MNHNLLVRLSAAEQIVIGLSGGADSIALTHILFTRFGSEKLLCAHVNHGIRGAEGDRDEAFVREFCQGLGLSLQVKEADVPALAKAQGLGLEECGRNLRYHFFQSLCRGKNSLVATAHNADDNAETVLFHLIRGSGLSGLCGIPEQRGNIVRPVLHMTRSEIEAYCKEQGLSYITDSSNLENQYARNKIRNIVLPALREINSSAVENINSSADILEEASVYIGVQAQALLLTCETKQGLSTAPLLQQPDYLIKELLRLYLKKRGCGCLEQVHLVRLCHAVRHCGSVTVPGSLQVAVGQGVLTVKPVYRVVQPPQALFPGIPQEYGRKKIVLQQEKMADSLKINNLLFNKALDCDKIKNVLTVAPRKEGERFLQQGRGVQKSLKKLFNEAKIPAALRDELVILRDGDQIAYIEGFGPGEEYCIDSTTKACYVVKIMSEDEYGERYDE